MNDFFKVLADETRLRCLSLILEYNEVCVCELIEALDLPQSKISRHLSIIKLNNIISQRRVGQWMMYSLHPDLSVFKHSIIEQTIKELSSQPLFKKDMKQLSKMDCRPSGQIESMESSDV